MGLRAVILGLGLALASLPVEAVTLVDSVGVNAPGNQADSTGLGAVAYGYQIGKFEVLNSQYVAFLNAVAKTDPYGLYASQMSSAAEGGINRSGLSGSYVYSLKLGYANYPVIYASFYDAARFVNWLQNGQPTGGLNASTTEDGAYTFSGATTMGPRNPGARFALPGKDEWYKAAFYEPSGQGGSYWQYTTRANVLPNSRGPNASDANSANFYYDDGVANGINAGYAVTGSTTFNSSINYLTPAGGYSAAAGPWGTFDQGGNAREWLELGSDGSAYIAGDAWVPTDIAEMSSAGTIYLLGPGPTFESASIGFRVVIVPEPSVVGLSAIGLSVAWLLGRTGKGHVRRSGSC